MTQPASAHPTPSTAHAERTQARVLALQYLYSRDVLKGASDEEVAAFFDAEGVVVKTVRDYAERIVHGVLDDQARLDQEIQEAARNWSVGRMPAVDRNIVRICWFEMRTLEVPPAVAINEAIELGKEFSTENSGAFINGVLDQLHKTRLMAQPADATIPVVPAAAPAATPTGTPADLATPPAVPPSADAGTSP
jgi:N utilization substance protein B